MSNVFYNITAGNPRKLIKPILFTVLSYLINVLPFVLVVYAVKIIFISFTYPDVSLDVAGLVYICGTLFVYLVVMFYAEGPAYDACYGNAYAAAAEGRVKLAEHIRRLPLGYLTGRDPGVFSGMLMGDFALLEMGISHIIPQMCGALILPVLAFIGLSFLDWRLAMSMFVALPASMIILMVAARIVRVLGSVHMKAKLEAASRLQEYLTGIRVIKVNNLKGVRFERLETSFRKLMRESIRLEGFAGPVVLLALASVRSGLTLTILLGTYLLVGGQLDPFVFVTFLIVGARVFDPLTVALVNFVELQYNEQAGKRITELYAEPFMGGDSEPPEFGDINIESVAFEYQEKLVLRDISTYLKQGTLTALVGPSGSGKSTMLKLIARFYDPKSGNITFGGADISGLNPESYYRKLSMVFQDVYLFQDTIGNNIRFGNNDATDEDLINAAHQACCHDFIMKLPQGYDTMVGEGGCTLSGGEKQRISIARAFLKDATVVLLDEVTASLDPENEQEVQKAINTLIKGRTVVVIAHKLKTICRADKIIVLNNGQIAEEGKHEALLAKNGLYARLWQLQQDAVGWSIL